MLVTAIACVHDRAIYLLREKADGARLVMAHDQEVGMHGVQCERSVDQGFALFDRGGLHRHVHHIRAEALARKLEAGLGAGRVFEEHVDLRFAREDVAMLIGPTILGGVGLGKVQNSEDVRPVEGLDSQQVAMREWRRARIGRHGAPYSSAEM